MRTFLALSLFAAGACAQTFIVPSTLTDGTGTRTATAVGNAYEERTFSATSARIPHHPVRVQHVWDVSDIPVPAAFLKGMKFRRADLPTSFPMCTVQMSIELSVGPSRSAFLSTTFATNQGANVTTVFNGTAVLPASSSVSGPGPFAASIPFTQHFPYVAAAGNTLVADIRVTSCTSANGITGWFLDTVREDRGLMEDNGPHSTCMFSNGQVDFVYPQGLNPVFGSSWTVIYSALAQRLPLGLPALGLLGFTGVGGSWQGRLLPFALPGVPTCSLFTSIDVTIPLVEQNGYYSWPKLLVPNEQGLRNRVFHDQGLFMDAGANALGIVLGTSHKWTIRTGYLPTGAKLWQEYNQGNPFPGPTTGFMETKATVVEFTY